MYNGIASILGEAAEDKDVTVAVLTGETLNQVQKLCISVMHLRVLKESKKS